MSNAQTIYNVLRNAGATHAGACGMLGNLEAESKLSSTNMENSYESRLGYNDTTYTSAVDKGTYSNFVHDSVGYGIAQWTYYTRKQGLLSYAKSLGKSIGDLSMQTQYLIKELKSDFSPVWKVLTTTTSIQDASNAVLLNFERPANATAQKAYRYNLSIAYNTLTVTSAATEAASSIINTVVSSITKLTCTAPQLSQGNTGTSVKNLQRLLNNKGFDCGSVDGEFGAKTLAAVKSYQQKIGVTTDGVVGTNTWNKLLST